MTIANIAAGLGIFMKYEGSTVQAEHDIIFAGPPDIHSVSKEDQATLKTLGWFIDNEVDSWACFP